MNVPRILIAGTHSGSGKTTAVCAILALLKEKGLSPAAYKCGPDYIDPMFHRQVLGLPSANLDPFFSSGEALRARLMEGAHADISVIEGVMGYYDGSGPSGTDFSTWSVAKETASPAVLVADGKGASASLLAVLEGFLRFQPESGIRGIIFNRMKPGVYQYIKKLLVQRFGGQIRPLGYIPPLPEECIFGSRHLGLITADEIQDLSDRISRLAALCKETIDLDGLIGLAQAAPPLSEGLPALPSRPSIRLAVARDEAFCFLYPDTLRLFAKMGAEIAYFSPLQNEALPDGACGLYLPGGYPELHAGKLEQAARTRESIRRAWDKKMPVLAECGGFQYLGGSIDGKKMCGLLPGESRRTDSLVRFGYVELSFPEAGLFGPAGTRLKAHEFHYYDSSENGSQALAKKTNGREYACAFYGERLYAGYPHLYLPAAPKAALAFYEKCLTFKEEQFP